MRPIAVPRRGDVDGRLQKFKSLGAILCEIRFYGMAGCGSAGVYVEPVCAGGQCEGVFVCPEHGAVEADNVEPGNGFVGLVECLALTVRRYAGKGTDNKVPNGNDQERRRCEWCQVLGLFAKISVGALFYQGIVLLYGSY